MRTSLFPHNEEVYGRVMTAFADSDRTCIVQPTGTGKSYVISAVSESFPKVAIVGPNRFVLNQVRSGLSWHGNVDYMTYQKVNADGGMVGGDYDLIVLDEFHRVGAEKWGDSVNVFLAMNPQAKVLGASATPVRYLDGGRDMCEELFEGNVASRIGIGESWARGILPVPTYVTGLYSYDGVYDETKGRLDGDKELSDKEREERMEKLISSKTHWEDSNGMAVILAKHLPKDTHRVIIFCSDVERLRSLSNPDDDSGVVGWFRKAGFNVLSVNSVDYTKSRKVLDRELAEFESDTNGEGIRLMFSVDMFNEGVHIPDVGGVLMLRTTESKIIFMQQMGRCLTVANAVEPVVFDMVDNLSDIGVVKDLVKGLFEEYEQEREKLDATERVPFKVVDYCLEVSDLIERLCPEKESSERGTVRGGIDHLCEWCETEKRVPTKRDGKIFDLYINVISDYRDDDRVIKMMRKYGRLSWIYDKEYIEDTLSKFVLRKKRFPTRCIKSERKYSHMYILVRRKEPNSKYFKKLQDIVAKNKNEKVDEKINYAVEYYTKQKDGEDVSSMKEPEYIWTYLMRKFQSVKAVSELRKRHGRPSPVKIDEAKRLVLEYFGKNKCLPTTKWLGGLFSRVRRECSNESWFIELMKEDESYKVIKTRDRYIRGIREFIEKTGHRPRSSYKSKEEYSAYNKLKRLNKNYGVDPVVTQFFEEIGYKVYKKVSDGEVKDGVVAFMLERHHVPKVNPDDEVETYLARRWYHKKERIIKAWPEILPIVEKYDRPKRIFNAIQAVAEFEERKYHMPTKFDDVNLYYRWYNLKKNYPNEPEVKAWIVKYGK